MLVATNCTERGVRFYKIHHRVPETNNNVFRIPEGLDVCGFSLNLQTGGIYTCVKAIKLIQQFVFRMR